MNGSEGPTETAARLAALEERVRRIEQRLQPAAPWARSDAGPYPRPQASATAVARPWRPGIGRPGIEMNLSRVLAVAGGLVLLAGLGFLLRYAVVRGWLGPEVRVVLGLAGSGLLATFGVRLERAATTRVVGRICTATGAAGAYIAVVAASVGYELIPASLGLAGATMIAGGAVARGAWSRGQQITILGVGGALIAPVLLDVPPAATVLGFIVVALAAAAAVAVVRDWPAVTAVGFLIVAPQLWSLEGSVPEGVLLTVGAVCSLIVLAACVVHARGRGGRHLVVPGLVLGFNAVSMAGLGWAAVSDGVEIRTAGAGAWVLATAAVHVAAGILASRRWFAAPVGVVATTAGMVLACVGVLVLAEGYVAGGLLAGLLAAQLAGGAVWAWWRPAARVSGIALTGATALHAVEVTVPLARAGSLEAVAVVTALCGAAVTLALVGRRVAGETAAIVGGAMTGTALVRLLTVEAPLWSLLEGSPHLLAAVGMCAALVLAGLLLGWWVQRPFTTAAVTVANYGVSLAAVAMDPEGVGRVALTGLWALGGGVALVAGRRLARSDVRRGGAALLAAAVTKAALVDTTTLDGTHRAVALLLCGAVLVATAVAEARRSGDADGDADPPPDPVLAP